MKITSRSCAVITRSVVVGLVLAFSALSASAATIAGDLTFSGDFSAGGPLSIATSLSFPANDFDVDGSSGDFSGIAQGDIGSISDFNLVGPAQFSIAGFSFNISDIQVVTQSDAFLLLTGTGTVTAAGFDATDVVFALSANVNGPLSNFSAGASAIPLPGALILFGSALAGALGFRRR
ncbi:MAG: hypothetical protein OER80_04650 [Gammaproteobacteria bacterium]|nr:hypothetical protein [Gammaproteobacteria bacterium]